MKDKYIFLPILIFILIMNLFFGFFSSKETFLFKDLTEVDHISFDTGYTWYRNHEDSFEQSLPYYLSLVNNEIIGHIDSLEQWTYSDSVTMTLFNENRELYQITVYRAIDSPVGKSEILVLEWENKIYRLPQLSWSDFLLLSQNSVRYSLLPPMRGSNILYFSLYSLKEGNGSNEYRYSLEKDLRGEWTLSFLDVFSDQNILINESEVNLLLLQLQQWRGNLVQNDLELSITPIYTIEIRDNLGNRYQWQVGVATEEGLFPVRSLSDNLTYLLTAEELKKVSPPVSRLILQ